MMLKVHNLNFIHLRRRRALSTGGHSAPRPFLPRLAPPPPDRLIGSLCFVLVSRVPFLLGCSVAYSIYSIEGCYMLYMLYSILHYSTTLRPRCKFWYLT